MAVFSKSNIANGVIIEKEIKHGILLVKSDKHFYYTIEDIYICFVYPP